MLAAAVTTLSSATGKMLNDPDVIVSYSTFQAEAAINRLIRSNFYIKTEIDRERERERERDIVVFGHSL